MPIDQKSVTATKKCVALAGKLILEFDEDINPQDACRLISHSVITLFCMYAPINGSPFYKGVTVAEYQVIVVELLTCVPIKSPPAAVIIR